MSVSGSVSGRAQVACNQSDLRTKLVSEHPTSEHHEVLKK